MSKRMTYPYYHNTSFWQQIPGMRWIARMQFDGWLTLLISLLLIISFALLQSASQKETTLIKHSLHVIFGAGIFLTVAQIPPRFFKQWAPVFYGLGVFLLLIVLMVGASAKGAQRWIQLSIFKFQPSEFMKLITPLMLAYYLAKRPVPLKMSSILISLVIIFIPGLLIAKQPDLGTAILVISTGLGVLFFAGLPWRWILQLTILLLAAMPLLWWKMHDYQRQRILTFLDPERDPLGSGYHIIQSKIAIGSGGLWGKGWGQGTQGQLNFLPERTTDFIFSVLGEEFGFVGVGVLFLLYFAIILRGAVIMTHNADPFGRYMAGGIFFGFFVCFFINIGMVSGLLPVVGCPLPIISYGGTSMVTWMTAFGMLVAIQAQQQKLRR